MSRAPSMQMLPGDVPLAFLDTGAGDPVLLIHGFASSAAINWVAPGWVETLAGDGRRVVALDNRGHGGSGKPHDPAAYAPPILAADALRLLEALSIADADVIGYSLGARIGAELALRQPSRVRSLVLAGIGEVLITGRLGNAAIAEGMLAGAPTDIADPRARLFRDFADRSGADRAALAACLRGTVEGIPPERLATLTPPVLIAVGDQDDIAADVAPLLAALPGAEFLPIPGRDHMKAVGDRSFKSGVLDFLRRRP